MTEDHVTRHDGPAYPSATDGEAAPEFTPSASFTVEDDGRRDIGSVSYTHLDVYKRQAYPCVVDATVGWDDDGAWGHARAVDTMRRPR